MLDNQPNEETRVEAEYANLSTVIQDYLKAIWHFNENSIEKVSTSMLSNRLKVANSTVSENLKKMSEQNLVNYQPYSGVNLTEIGKNIAIFMVRRHRILESYLHNFLGYKPDEVHDEAETLEHTVSNKLIDRMNTRLGDPLYDPHGDPIPQKNGFLPPNQGINLLQELPNQKLIITRIIDINTETTNYLYNQGIRLNETLIILAKDQINQTIKLNLVPLNKEIILGSKIAELIWVKAES